MNQQTVRVWDLPTRVFHWTLFLLVAAALVTGELGGNLMDWHGRIGLAILGLLVFRLVWGLVGSTYARFANFIPGPRAVLAYLRGSWHGLGHNPVGAFSVLALLAVLGFQAATGLVADDDIAFHGPLYPLVSAETAARLTGWHRLNVAVIVVLVTLHLGAILFYTLVKKDTLVRPMITGEKATSAPGAVPATGGGWVALMVAVLVAVGAVAAATGALLAPPPPPPVEAVPAW